MNILDGVKTAQIIREQISSKIQKLKTKTNITPSLSVILIGDDPASEVYVKHKISACKKAGIKSQVLKLEKNISPNDLKTHINRLKDDPKIHGILVQLPLPDHLNTYNVLSWLPPEKDVDGLTTQNIGLLWSGKAKVRPCTPLGIIRLLEHYQIPIEGQSAVVVGRSQIVGLPMARLLLEKNASVTVCHSKTRRLIEHTLNADIVVAACGRRHELNYRHFKKGAVVVDVGIHRTLKNGKTILEGDVCPDELEKTIAWLAPVPGGVGPMTIAMLIENTYQLAL